MLSHHFSLAGDYARAHRYAMAAAKRATERFSHADAAGCIGGDRGGAGGRRRRRCPSLAEAWEQLGEALRCIGEPAAAARALTEARRLLRDDRVAQARLCHRHAGRRRQRRDDRGRALAESRITIADGLKAPRPPRGAPGCAHISLGSAIGQGRWAEAISACRQAISEAEPLGELRALAHACYALDWALVESGHRDEATHSSQALEIYEQLGDPEHESNVLNNLGGFAYWDGLWDDAIALYRRSGAAGERAGRPGFVAGTDCNVGEILSDRAPRRSRGAPAACSPRYGTRRASGNALRRSTCSWLG